MVKKTKNKGGGMNKRLIQQILNTPLFRNPIYRYFYWQQVKRLIPKLIDRPRRVIVENTNYCNLKCSFCPNPIMERPKGFMSFDLWKKIVDQCVELGIEHIYHFGIGEPLLDKDYRDKCFYAKCQGIKDLHCVTNGVLLKTLPLTDYVGITVNDEKVIPNVARIFKQKEGINRKVEIECRLKEDTAHLKPKLKNICDKVDIYLNITSWGDKIKGNVPKGLKFPCSDLWSSMFILWDGQAALCCKDYEGSFNFGNLNNIPLIEAWRNMNNVRKVHLKNLYVGICANCESNTHLVNPYWRVEL